MQRLQQRGGARAEENGGCASRPPVRSAVHAPPARPCRWEREPLHRARPARRVMGERLPARGSPPAPLLTADGAPRLTPAAPPRRRAVVRREPGEAARRGARRRHPRGGAGDGPQDREEGGAHKVRARHARPRGTRPTRRDGVRRPAYGVGGTLTRAPARRAAALLLRERLPRAAKRSGAAAASTKRVTRRATRSRKARP